ncbi:MAG: hypothetical protein PHQ96_08530 [Candidatus Omnitrophica bacterium]|nr:hypothetical protein [Candidatus Omnitrophota bacterium]
MIRHKRKIVLFLIGVFLVAFAGCRQESFSRYPSVMVPQLSNEDYYNLLYDKNTQVVYNAVVNLGAQAEDFAGILSDKKADKNSPKYISAEKIYKRVGELLAARDANTVAVSLHFLQSFGKKSGEKANLLEPILKIKSNNPNVLYEQIKLLNIIADKNSGVTDSGVRKFLNNPSWIVSRSAYLLVDNLENDNLRNELIARYNNVSDETEKLLILTAFQNHPGDAAADFFFSQLLSTKNSKIRRAIYDILGNCKNQEKVLAWVSENYEKIIASDGKYFFAKHASTLENNFSAKLLVIFLNKGFVADKAFLKSLDEKLEKYAAEEPMEQDDKENLSNVKMVEEALIAQGPMAAAWKSMRDEKAQLKAKLDALQTEYDAITGEFSAKAGELLRKYGVSEEKIKEYLTDATNSREILSELLMPGAEGESPKDNAN